MLYYRIKSRVKILYILGSRWNLQKEYAMAGISMNMTKYEQLIISNNLRSNLKLNTIVRCKKERPCINSAEVKWNKM